MTVWTRSLASVDITELSNSGDEGKAA